MSESLQIKSLHGYSQKVNRVSVSAEHSAAVAHSAAYVQHLYTIIPAVAHITKDTDRLTGLGQT